MSELVSELVPNGAGGFLELKRFADSGIMKALNDAAAQIKPGNNVAVVLTKHEGQYAGTVVGRFGGHITVMGRLQHEPVGGWDHSAAIQWQGRLF